jgi:DNA-binding transcriptional regulator YiaG
MTSKEFCLRLKHCGITARAFADMVGYRSSSVAKWKVGDSPVPEPIADKLIQICKAIDEIFPSRAERVKGKKG